MGNYVSQSEWDAISRMKFTPTELRLDRLEREYLFMAAMSKTLWQRFDAAGDADCARIANSWYWAARNRYAVAYTLQKQIEAGKRADRIAARHGKAGR